MCFKKVSGVFLECFKEILRLLQGNFHGCLKDDLRKLQGYFKSASKLRREVSILFLLGSFLSCLNGGGLGTIWIHKLCSVMHLVIITRKGPNRPD